MKPLLLVLNPRRIPECVDAIEQLAIDKAWLTGYTEPQLEQAIPDLLDQVDHDPILVLSDDTVPEQPALDSVLHRWRESSEIRPTVATGFCNLDVVSQYVNLTRRPFTTRHSTVEAYDFYTYAEMGDQPQDIPVRSWFTGMCLTCMSREHWDQFPFQTYEGRSSDFMLSLRLQDALVPILAPKDAMVWHVKQEWNKLDDSRPERRLLIGEIPAETRLDLQQVPA